MPPAQAAVLGYTSGSTGVPKAVMMTHLQFRRSVLILSEGMNYCADDRLPLFGSLSGGQGISTTLTALLNGAALCPVSPGGERRHRPCRLADAPWCQYLCVLRVDLPEFHENGGAGLQVLGIRAVRLSRSRRHRTTSSCFSAIFRKAACSRTLSHVRRPAISRFRGALTMTRFRKGASPSALYPEARRSGCWTKTTARLQPARWEKSSSRAGTSPRAIGAILHSRRKSSPTISTAAARGLFIPAMGLHQCRRDA